MPTPITQAQPPLEFIPPAFNPLIYQTTRLLLPLWARWHEQLVEIQVSHAEELVTLYQQFQEGKIRFMMAFRHPNTNDPLAMYSLLSQTVPQMARQQGIQLKSPIHAHFIYDRGIPLWAGEPVGWLYSRLGGTPIRRGRVDLAGLRSIRHLFADGQFPMAAAPEGATNGHNEIVSPIEPGVAQFGFWCVEDLLKAERAEQVMIVPIGIQYHYVAPSWEKLEQILNQLEADSGLPPYSGSESEDAVALAQAAQMEVPTTTRQQAILYKRLIRLGEHLLSVMEKFYTKFYHQAPQAAPTQIADMAEASTEPSAEGRSQSELEATANQQLQRQLYALLNTALTVSEQYFGLSPKGDLTDRCRRLEQAGWDWIYREDLKQLEALPPIERGLADRIAEEANLRLWHMRLVETFVSVTGRYILEKPTVERFAEVLLLLWDVITRIKGKVPFPRPHLGPQRVQMTIGKPLSVSDRWDAYRTNRRQAVETLTQDLQTALEAMIT